jgi:hypothetical protein
MVGLVVGPTTLDKGRGLTLAVRFARPVEQGEISGPYPQGRGVSMRSVAVIDTAAVC